MRDPGSGDGSDPSLEAQLEALLDSFLERFRNGEQPSIEEYARRRPDLARKIQEVFPASTFLGEIESAPTSQQDKPAARLGEYRILREIGRGGMGVVYEAEQSSLGRRVAVKVLPFHGLMDARIVERFHREARAAARLQHPGIVPVIGMGEDSGVHFYAMQLVDGSSVDHVLRDVRRLCRDESARPPEPGIDQRPASVSARFARTLLGDARTPSPGYFEAVARWVKDAAEALAYAHEQGVLHRDIKPSNLLLDASGRVLVTDFGLASVEGATDLTPTGQVLGTLRYLAPETIHGAADQRSDIYSLGITLHELLTLEPAFAGSNRAAVLAQVSAGTLRPPRELDPQIPPPLEAIALKATCREPADRYASAVELAADLGRFLEGRRIAVRLPWLDPRLRRSARIRRGSQALVGAVLVLLAALGIATWLPRQPLEPQDLLVEDVDGDGDADLVVANSGVSTDPALDSIAIALNDGDGGFRRPRFVAVGDLPLGLARCDLDGDRSQEIVFANCNSRELFALERGANGSFRARKLAHLPSRPSDLAAADLDADGRDDVSVVLYPSRDVLILWNEEQSPFQQRTAVTVGPAPYFIGAADLNGDGKPDLITTNGLEGFLEKENLSIVLNRGERSFEAARHRDLGEPGMGFTTLDLDGDDHPDLAVALERAPKLLVFLNAGDGTFSGEALERALPSPIWTLSSADLDGDLHLDLAGAGDGGAYWMRNDGQARFADPIGLPAGTRPAHVQPADLDGDGDLDLAITNLGSDDITALFNEGRGQFSRVERLALKSWLGW